jgi:hypothetical protein
MKKNIVSPFAPLLLLIVVTLVSCEKSGFESVKFTNSADDANGLASLSGLRPIKQQQFTTYTIQQGNHSCDQSSIKSVKTSEMKFVAVFDESAVYTSVIPENQYDINKLYGFSEGFNNQYNSARIGWNWYDNALHLHAYVYNKGVRASSEIKTVSIGQEIICSIKVLGSNYIFTVDGVSVTLGRGLATASASGYQQYPYFGGDEVAPHKISIKIKSL